MSIIDVFHIIRNTLLFHQNFGSLLNFSDFDSDSDIGIGIPILEYRIPGIRSDSLSRVSLSLVKCSKKVYGILERRLLSQLEFRHMLTLFIHLKIIIDQSSLHVGKRYRI